MEPTTTYEEEGKKYFFPAKTQVDYRLIVNTDAQGSKFPSDVKGRSCALKDYMHFHGYYPSKTKIFLAHIQTRSFKYSVFAL